MEKRTFDDVVKGIESAESDVDRVLDAGRLERHEGPSTRLSADQKAWLLELLIGSGTILGVLWMFIGRF